MPPRDASPPIPGLDVQRARQYRNIRLIVLAVSLAWSLAQSLWWIRRRRAQRVFEGVGKVAPARGQSFAFFAVMTAASAMVSLPLSIVGGWLVEKRFALTTQSLPGFLREWGKGTAIAIVLQPLAMTGAWFVIRRRPKDWWLVLAGLLVPIAAVFGTLAPVLLAPIFNRFTPLQDEVLRERITRLSERSGTTISGVYVSDMSRQSEKPNAYFAGLGPTKRIVLSDTLLRDFTPAEIEGIVAHELGHQVHGDIWRMIATAGAVGLTGAWGLSKVAPWIVRRTASTSGVTSIADPACSPSFSMALQVIGFALAPVQFAVSRAIERRTDRYAVALTGDGTTYASALERLAATSLSVPDPPAWEVALFASHPPLADRIAAAKAAGSPS